MSSDINRQMLSRRQGRTRGSVRTDYLLLKRNCIISENLEIVGQVAILT